MSQANTLALTALPNGFLGANLRLSVVLTPSISTSDNGVVPVTGTPFDEWTKKVVANPPSWKVTFTQGITSLDSPGVRPEVALDLWPELWTAIFGSNRHAKNRRGNADIHDGWRLSHNITKLHGRHQSLRNSHAQRSLVANIAKTISDSRIITQLENVHSDHTDDIQSGAPPVIYLFPAIKGNAASAAMTEQVNNRNTAYAAKNTIDPNGPLGASLAPKITTRINHALDILETQEGARLQALALYCIYRHCTASVAPPTVSLETVPADVTLRALYDFYQTFTNAAINLIPILTLQVTPASNNTGKPITLTAILCPALIKTDDPPKGTVTFTSNGAVLATADLKFDTVTNMATATTALASLPVGVNNLQAAYSGSSGDSQYPAGFSDTIAYTVAAANAPLPPSGPRSTTPVVETPHDVLDAYQSYVELLLFHRKKPDPINPNLPAPPDFHQLLGMVNHYPALLRPLGLAFDLLVAIPYGLNDGTFTVTVAVASPFPVVPTSYPTQCQLYRDPDSEKQIFCAASRSAQVIQQGYLVLDGQASADQSSAYTFIQEDADGSSLKFSDQANNAARAAEYSSSAPTAMTILPASKRFRGADQPIVPTPASTANPTDAPPAPRTVGLSLVHQDKLATLAAVVNNTPPSSSIGNPATPPPPNKPLCAEDLMLGLRVDIQRNGRDWQSLCRRVSNYSISHIDLGSAIDHHVLTWTPSTLPEMAADEGFITFAATQTEVDDTTTQTQLHQSLFTWTGWSMAVQKPNGFQSVNPPNKPQTTGLLSIKPTFELPKPALLPALRFNHDYNVRCRVVDLAGNSVPFSKIDTPNRKYQTPLTPRFSRHEPIRAPQLLLTEAIDRSKSPGENIDHMIARDGHEPAPRMLVPPRESVRLAELHNMLPKGKRLPDSAFRGQYLMPNGTFPSVIQAHDAGWYHGDIDKEPTHNQDPIFLQGHSAPKNRYYPDPLAHYIRVKPFLVSDDPTLSRPLGNPSYIEIDPRDEWPDVFATVLGLHAEPNSNKPTVKFDNDSRPPSITVNLPPGFTVVLEISSAGYNGTDHKWRTDDSKAVALHQYNHARIQLVQRAAAYGSRQAFDFIGDETAQVRASSRAQVLDGIKIASKSVSEILDDPNSYIDGDLPQMTPPRTVTLVHAVHRPLTRPDFAPLKTAGDLIVVRQLGQAKADLRVGISANWLSTGKVTCRADWTDMEDDPKKDAPYPSSRQDVAFAITAFDTIAPREPDFEASTYIRMLKPTFSHGFTDTRAHTVTYTLSADTRFRGYYPIPPAPKPANPPAPSLDQSKFTQQGLTKREIVVCSSVRPPAPTVAYIVPAFFWRDTYEPSTRTWFSGREVLLRVYFERPFLLSGDLEAVGVVLATPARSSDDKTQPLVSRWGADPTRPITAPIASSALTADNLCQPNAPVRTCQLAEGDIADVKPCAIHYAKDRKLWFADIPVNTQGSYGPFVRLALVRWQPQALFTEPDPAQPPPAAIDPNSDARISPVVIADFIQISPNRWVSVHRKTDSVYVITISGCFPPPDAGPVIDSPTTPTLTLTLLSRWYATGRDTGWRPVDCHVAFKYTPASTILGAPADPNRAISSWSTTLALPHSAALRKYRILLRENEWFSNSKIPRVVYSQFVDLP